MRPCITKSMARLPRREDLALSTFEAQSQPVVLALAVACVLLLAAVVALVIRDRRRRSPAVSADEALRAAFAGINRRLDSLESGVAQITAHLPKTVQGVGVVRYNPFPDMGGAMSFSLALLDGRANGIVVSVLNNRDSARVYGKPVEGGESSYTLSDEERQALALARGQRR
jgi:hypothetical protein